MNKLDKEILIEVLKLDDIWTKPKKVKGHVIEPELLISTVIRTANIWKENRYQDEIIFPTYHRFIRKLKGIIEPSDPKYCELHFEEVEGELWFGADCPQCQWSLDIQLDKILTRYCDNHPEWRERFYNDDKTRAEIDALAEQVSTKPIYQPTLF